MTIPYFSSNQNVVFIPALFALLAATVVICLPIVFAPALRRSARRVPLLVMAAVVAAAALAGTAVLAADGFRTLGAERAAVRAWIATTYRVDLDAGEVGELIDGGKPEKALPSIADALNLKHPEKTKPLELKPTVAGGDTYALYFDGKAWPAS